MRVAIMQPYFLPYIGYFQLLNLVDAFVIYDNVKYTKKGWINRNRLLQSGTDILMTIPLQHASDHSLIVERFVSPNFQRAKLLNMVSELYRRAPHFDRVFSMFEYIVHHDDRNLFGFLQHSLAAVCDYLRIKPKVIVSSSVPIDHQLCAQEKVLAICKALGATEYVNPEGGVSLYSADSFLQQELRLRFLRAKPVPYQQFGNDFVPFLSILDVLMFNSVEVVNQKIVSEFEIFEGSSHAS